MIQETHTIHIGEHSLDLVKLPEAAQQELVTFYEFLLFKYQGRTDMEQSEKQRVLTHIFQEANGILPDDYSFDREALHER